MGLKSWVKGFLGFFGITITRTDISKFFELEKELENLQVSVEQDPELMNQDLFLNNIIDAMKEEIKVGREKGVDYLEGKQKGTAEDIIKIVESSIIPALKASAKSKKEMTKTSQEELIKDIKQAKSFFDQLREDLENA